jgi:hypothetical protein
MIAEGGDLTVLRAEREKVRAHSASAAVFDAVWHAAACFGEYRPEEDSIKAGIQNCSPFKSA